MFFLYSLAGSRYSLRFDAKERKVATVTFGHRTASHSYARSGYETFFSQLSASLSKIDGINSLVVCGSLIKDTLVPSWSDLDLILFVEDKAMSSDLLHAIGSAIYSEQTKTQIPVGVDIVRDRFFFDTMRFGGRPLAMSFEVKGYGRTVFGADFLKYISWQKEFESIIDQEKKKLIAAEIHNWRRWLMSNAEKSTVVPSLARHVKTCLKLAKYESDPNLEPPYTYPGCIEKLKLRSPLPDHLSVWERAVETRENWGDIITSKDQAEVLNDYFSKALAEYKEE